MPVEARPAATVVVMREGADGPELLMLRRSGRAGFFPHAWVFPGGRVDPADSSANSQGSVRGLEAADRAYAVGAIRECFEEAGVWMGMPSPPPELRDALNNRTATLSDAPQLVADLDRLRLWSWWITPEVEPKRYDTRFFLAVLSAEEAEGAAHDDIETVSSIWITPRDALTRADGDGFFLAPPTFRTIEELAEYPNAAAAFDAATDRRVRPVMPRLDMSDDGGWAIVLPGDASYPSDEPVDGPTRIVFRQGRWWSTDS